jgi:hypothetical protein
VVSPLNLYLINRLKFKGNQHLFQREGHFKRKHKSKKKKGIPVHHEKALFLLCHIVVLVVKLICGTGIGKNGVGIEMRRE